MRNFVFLIAVLSAIAAWGPARAQPYGPGSKPGHTERFFVIDSLLINAGVTRGIWIPNPSGSENPSVTQVLSNPDSLQNQQHFKGAAGPNTPIPRSTAVADSVFRFRYLKLWGAGSPIPMEFDVYQGQNRIRAMNVVLADASGVSVLYEFPVAASFVTIRNAHATATITLNYMVW